MRMEAMLAKPVDLAYDLEIFERHRQHWNAETIQEFWAGISWNIAGDSNELSYHLAQILWRKIEKDMEAPQFAMLGFAADAVFEDAGQASCQKHLGVDLQDIVEDFLGEGNWAPDPSKWNFGVES